MRLREAVQKIAEYFNDPKDLIWYAFAKRMPNLPLNTPENVVAAFRRLTEANINLEDLSEVEFAVEDFC